MDIFTIIAICLIFYLGYVTGSYITYFKASRVFRQLAEALGIDLEKELIRIRNLNEKNRLPTISRTTYYLETEVHGDMIYLFDKEHNDFIAQAKSLEELAKLAKENKKIVDAVVVHGDKVFHLSDGKFEEKTTV